MSYLYIKKGKKYIPAPSYWNNWTGFPCDGIWLVQSKEHSKSHECILQIGDLPKLYPFANMMVFHDDLASFIGKWQQEKRKSSIGPMGTTTWLPSNSDFAKDILKFLAQKTEEKNDSSKKK